MSNSGKATRPPKPGLVACVVVIALVLCLLHWGGAALVSEDPLPAHAQAAIVLQGSIAGEKARLDGALRLAERGIVDRVLVSVPHESYWGQAIPPVARQFIERNYGAALAARVDFCETGPGVDSTAQEAVVLISCIQQNGWRSVIVVTSEYHTRRAGILWAREILQAEPTTTVAMEGVPDADFRVYGWWRNRRSAKTWFLESTKLIWMLIGS